MNSNLGFFQTIQCLECPLKFPVSFALDYHQKIAHRGYAKMCTTCGKVVADLSKHRLVHTLERPHKCDLCDFQTARKSTLTRHRFTHSNTDEGKDHQCDLCEKAFYDSKTLKEHRLTHEKIKPYQCTVKARQSSFNKTDASIGFSYYS